MLVREITSDNKPLRAPNGQLLPGHTANPNGRPVGSGSIRDSIRRYLKENPEEMDKLVKRLVDEQPGFMWQMMEGAPPKAIVVGNLDGSNIGEPNKAIAELTQKLNEIHGTGSIGGDGITPLALDVEASDKDQ